MGDGVDGWEQSNLTHRSLVLFTFRAYSHPLHRSRCTILIQTQNIHHFIPLIIMLASFLYPALARMIVDPVTCETSHQFGIVEGALVGTWGLAQNTANGTVYIGNEVALKKSKFFQILVPMSIYIERNCVGKGI